MRPPPPFSSNGVLICLSHALWNTSLQSISAQHQLQQQSVSDTLNAHNEWQGEIAGAFSTQVSPTSEFRKWKKPSVAPPCFCKKGFTFLRPVQTQRTVAFFTGTRSSRQQLLSITQQGCWPNTSVQQRTRCICMWEADTALPWDRTQCQTTPVLLSAPEQMSFCQSC